MWTFRANNNRQRGIVAVILVVFLAGGSLSFLLLNDTADFFQNLKEQRRLRDEKSVAEAQQSLLRYMLLRSQYPYDIARPGGKSIHPRLLMLPCPDNVGDKNLDGTQDATCATKPPSPGNIVSGILDSGSRFGRLPWRTGSFIQAVDSSTNKINDGLGEDFRDSHGNRLWYALSKNLAPQNKHTKPFNLHRLAALDDGWLSVVDIPEGGATASTLSNRVVAVVLSPGKHKSARLNERTLVSSVFSSHRDIDPTLYFESVTTHVSGGATIYANNNKDGVFVQLRKAQRGDFDDTLAYITLDEVMNADGHFLPLYKKLAGINNVQNQPSPHSPLAQMASVLSAYYDFFGFYPTPAAQSLSANITTVFRHCAAYHSGAKMLSAVVNPGAVFLLPNTIAAANLSATISLTAISELLAAENLTLSLIDPPPILNTMGSTVITTTLHNTVVMEDNTIRASSMAVIARYARLRLLSGALLSGSVIPSPGDRVTLAAATTVRFVAKTPFAPAGDLSGWFPEHYKTTMRAGDDNRKFTIQAGVRAGFLLPTQLSANTTVTLLAKDHISLAAGAAIHLEKDLKTLFGSVSVIVSINGVAHFADGTTTILAGYKPSPSSFEQRQHVVFLLADAKGSKTITAPAVLYPWRKRTSSSAPVITRDNLHPYPPCLDTRNFFDDSFRAFVQDQPTFYAVAAECHYGGNSQCGNMTVGGLTVNVGASVTVALPAPLTVTQTYTATIHNVNQKHILSISGGVISGVSASLKLIQDYWFPVKNGTTFLGRGLMAQGTQLKNGETVIFAAQTPFIAETTMRFEQVRALLIYSPSPLPRIPCDLGMGVSVVMTASSSTITVAVADQRGNTGKITALCRWMDNEENADGGGVYFIPPPPPPPPEDNRLSSPNDYFMLFGGMAVW